MDMQEQLRKIQEEATSQLESIRDKAGLDALRLKTLGKKGDLTLMLRSMGQLPAEERPKAGQMINVVREKLTEQMDALDADGIPYDDTPGVSSFCGAAAALNAEYTLPTVSQTVIITRMEGRTPVPEREKLASLAAHGATMVIFLSIGLVDKVQDALLQGGAYTPDTPAAVVYKATWPEQKTVRCTVGSLAQSVHDAGITKTALIVAGDFLGTRYERSKLYDPGFTTEFRKGSDQ